MPFHLGFHLSFYIFYIVGLKLIIAKNAKTTIEVAMFNANSDKSKGWLPYILGMSATAVLTVVGSELVRWGVDELKALRNGKLDAKKPSSE